MNKETIYKSETEISKGDFLIEEIPYKGAQSPELDEHLKSRKTLYARRDSLSEPTKDAIIISEWQVPCHVIFARTPGEGMCQGIHVQPNKFSASLITQEQEQALRALGQKRASAIAAKGKRAWFNHPDITELQKLGLNYERTIDVDTYERWRTLYDPNINQIWVDVQDKKVLKKYAGF